MAIGGPSPTLLADVMERVYSDIHPYIVRLWVEPVLDGAELVNQLDEMLVNIRLAPDADHRTAALLVQRSKELLNRSVGRGAEVAKLCQLGVRYLVLEDDGDDDAISLFGLDDDAELFNAICVVLGESDLRVGLG